MRRRMRVSLMKTVMSLSWRCTDDIINVAGHRLSTGGMEEVLSAHPDVAECAVIGADDKLKGQNPVGFIVLKNGVTKSDEGNRQ